jgi:3-oxoacyl-[acyl-carrier-protein] synthase-3
MTRLRGVDGVSLLGSGKALPDLAIDTQRLADLIAAGRWQVAGSPLQPAVIGQSRRKRDAEAILAEGGALDPLTVRKLLAATGVPIRYWTHVIGRPADHTEATSQDLAIAAGKAALADSSVAPAALGGVVVVTTTPPRPSVSTANQVSRALGVSGIALELKSGCAGGVYGLAIASALVGLGAGNILVVAAEAWSKLLPPDPTGPAAVAGDGAAAVIVGPGKGAFLGGAFEGTPEHAGAMMPPGLYPPTERAVAIGSYQIRITEAVAEVVRDHYPRVFEQALAAAGMVRDDLDLFIPHQASKPILRRAMRDCGMPAVRTFHTLGRYGNASSASVLLSLHDARAEGRLQSGSRVALVSVGGGIAAAAAVFRV